ncbi:MAG: class I SAM-dependent methyltransferase [Gammaproteobacteria bacterium]
MGNDELNIFKKVKVMAQLGYVAFRRGRINRDTEEVKTEYNATWNQFKNILINSESLDKWLSLNGLEDLKHLKNYEGQMCYSSFNVGNYNREMILKSILENFHNVQSITEFGCGVGRNLLYIKSKYPNIECYGYDICKEGISVAKDASEKFGVEVKYAVLDYVNAKDDDYIFPVTDVAFTLYSLEQISSRVETALINILSKVKYGTVHIEPIPENYPRTIRGFIARLDHWKVDYIRGFENRLQTIGDIIFTKKMLGTSHNVLMFPTLYCLKK